MYRSHLKHFFDVVLAAAALCCLAPLMALLCVSGAVCLRGTPFFTQVRIGKDEKPFRPLKFRSMTDRRDAAGCLLPDEDRLTRYGRFLRKTSLDELPELLNIIKGDMSLVGPRPLLPEYLPFYTAQERVRHTVRPGLTGLAQINGRNAFKSWDERLAYDVAYVRRYGFLFDCRIVAVTVFRVLRRESVLSGKEITAGRLDEVRSCHTPCE